MAIDYDSLMNFPVPDVRQTLTKSATAFYALSLGFGQDPTSEDQLRFVDHRRAIEAVPSMAVVMANPGFWYKDPRVGVDYLKMVHGEQDIELLAPLPVEGEIIGRTKVTGLVDKGEGKGALIYTQKQVIEAATGKVVALCNATGVLRGDGGFGGPTGPAKPVHQMPETAPDLVVDLPTRPEQALYYRLNGDDNALHADPAIAQKAGFPRPILHGLCTFGVVTHALLQGLYGYDASRLRKLSLRFSKPVFPGETIRTEIWQDGSFRARVVERDVVVIDNGLVAS